MYRKSVEREEGLTKNYYTFSLFDGKFFEGLKGAFEAFEEGHILATILCSFIGVGGFLIYTEIKVPPTEIDIKKAESEIRINEQMSSLQRCFKSPVNDYTCIVAYKAETDRLLLLETELLKRKVDEVKKAHAETEEKK